MAPYQAVECWENDLELIVPNLLDDSALKSTVFVCSSASSTRPNTPVVGILRQPTYLVANITITEQSSTVMPSHWPLTPSLSSDDELDDNNSNNNNASQRQRVVPTCLPQQRQSSPNSVHFPDDLIASINYRPRTHILDIPQLFYSAADIKKFKREYRNLVRVQSLARKRMEHNSNETIHGPCEVTTAIKPEHDNSFWRSKVHRRWSAPAVGDASSTEVAPSAVEQNDGVDDSWDPLNDGSISPSSSSSSNDEVQREEPASHYGGIFSSVFDVARDTLSVLNGSTNYNSLTSSSSYPSGSSKSPPRIRKQCATSLHLVDTLYLF